MPRQDRAAEKSKKEGKFVKTAQESSGVLFCGGVRWWCLRFCLIQGFDIIVEPR